MTFRIAVFTTSGKSLHTEDMQPGDGWIMMERKANKLAQEHSTVNGSYSMVFECKKGQAFRKVLTTETYYR